MLSVLNPFTYSRDGQIITLIVVLALVAIFFMDRAELYWRRYNAIKAIVDDMIAKGKMPKEHRIKYKEIK